MEWKAGSGAAGSGVPADFLPLGLPSTSTSGQASLTQTTSPLTAPKRTLKLTVARPVPEDTLSTLAMHWSALQSCGQIRQQCPRLLVSITMQPTRVGVHACVSGRPQAANSKWNGENGVKTVRWSGK